MSAGARWALLATAIMMLACAPQAALSRRGREAAGPGEAWLREQVRGNLEALRQGLDNESSPVVVNARDLPNGALASAVLQALPGEEAAADVDCTEAFALLQRFGSRFDMSFGGQGLPPLWLSYRDCFNETQQAWIRAAVAASLPKSIPDATPQEVSYTNMWLMSVVNSIVYGEMAGGAAGAAAADIGYTMLDMWVNYTKRAGIHEFTSPTYGHVQLTALYVGYIWAARPGARETFQWALDLLWADSAANWYEPQAALSGPHSRDYDTLLGHGMMYAEFYAHGLPGARPLVCEWRDPHCEGPAEGAYVGTMEPMTVLAISYYNLVHPRGYRPSSQIMALASIPERTVQGRFLAQQVTANGNEARFAERYNFVTPDFAMGSASQDYITNTHSKYYPYLGDKLVTILLGASSLPVADGDDPVRPRPLPQVSIQPDWMDNPYGFPATYPPGSPDKASHLAFHPGIVQSRNHLLVTLALDGQDALDGGFNTSGAAGDLYRSLATDVLLPLAADEWWLAQVDGANGTISIPADRSTPWSIPLHMGATLALRVGRGGLAIRTFVVDGAAGQQPSLLFQGDPDGMSLGAVRLTAQHFSSQKATNITDTHVRFGALFLADTVADHEALVRLALEAQQTTISSVELPSVDGSFRQWAVSASIPGNVSLAVVRNLTCTEASGVGPRNQTIHTRWNCLMSRQVNGTDVVPGPLRVNGQPVPLSFA